MHSGSCASFIADYPTTRILPAYDFIAQLQTAEQGDGPIARFDEFVEKRPTTHARGGTFKISSLLAGMRIPGPYLAIDEDETEEGEKASRKALPPRSA